MPTSCGEVSYCWSVCDKYVLRQQNVTLRLLLLLNRHPQLREGKGPMVRGAHHLNAAFVASLDGLWCSVACGLQPVLLFFPSTILSSLKCFVLFLGYQKFVDPGVSPEFQAAAIRFGITTAPPGVYMRYFCENLKQGMHYYKHIAPYRTAVFLLQKPNLPFPGDCQHRWQLIASTASLQQLLETPGLSRSGS